MKKFTKNFVGMSEKGWKRESLTKQGKIWLVWNAITKKSAATVNLMRKMTNIKHIFTHIRYSLLLYDKAKTLFRFFILTRLFIDTFTQFIF